MDKEYAFARAPCSWAPRRALKLVAGFSLALGLNLTLDQRLARFAPVHLGVDLSALPAGDHEAVVNLAKVGKLLDRLYLQQAWSGNKALHKRLRHHGDPKARRLFELFKGPWDRIEHNEPFLPNVPARPDGANFYPSGLTQAEFESWVATLSEADRARAQGFYDVVRRDKKGKLYLNTYAKEYADLLVPAAKLLKQAAATVTDASLRRFLSSRADAFRSNNYLPSELDWLRISNQSALEVTVGPYEVYTDALFAYKASYEMYIHARDFASSELLHKFTETLSDVERQLPVPNEYKNTNLRATPIVVVNQLYAAGDVAVPMTAAYNLPNDERAVREGGSKLVIIKNVQEAKYAHNLEPIAKLVLAEDQLKHLSFDAFFTHILLHEVAHSNGPAHVVNLPDVTIRSRLQELYSTTEEAKADIVGLFAAAYLLRKGVITGITTESFYTTYLASSFRSIRFGLNEAHGRGQAAQLNYLIDQDGFAYDAATGRFRVNFDRIEAAVSLLAHEILVLQGDGDKARVKAFLDKYAVNRDYTSAALARLAQVPIDVQPIYDVLNTKS
ncbi:MutT/nudix family protein [Thamnocephalis sphaerospora]|uniref:MutT/nudix family protein n=1 Tax=Thamnocephalis sphaerospora TaxID=78915 RepID=A0A4P9XI28_9FUNG|nr:MutT/nudix family protein [Thamnocephalis sphaerospora]|eukprot:RKP05352.1 MutT/nudix family protein [Thamnocephalis sphaerospora]